jgi:hypothetical protein
MSGDLSSGVIALIHAHGYVLPGDKEIALEEILDSLELDESVFSEDEEQAPDNED